MLETPNEVPAVVGPFIIVLEALKAVDVDNEVSVTVLETLHEEGVVDRVYVNVLEMVDGV